MKRTQPRHYRRILAAVDPAPFDEQRNALNKTIMDLATSLAHLENSELHIIHTWILVGEALLKGPRVNMSDAEMHQLVRNVKNEHGHWLNALLRQYALDKLKYQVHLLKGEAGVQQADTIFNLVFFIVLTSVLVQGSSIPLVARWLRVAAPLQVRRRSPLEFESTNGIRGELVEIELPAGSAAAGRRIVELGLPTGALLVLIGRGDGFFVPSGSTMLEAGDTLYLLANKETLGQMKQIL
jgi:hypothetical protein